MARCKVQARVKIFELFIKQVFTFLSAKGFAVLVVVQ
jgi:hypothetical protein